MALIMQSSDNGFVDAAAKTVRFPGQARAAAATPRQATGATFAEYQLGGAGIPTASAVTSVVYVTAPAIANPPIASPAHRVADPALINWTMIADPSATPQAVSIAQFQHLPFTLPSAPAAPENPEPAQDISFFDQLNCFGIQVLTVQTSAALSATPTEPERPQPSVHLDAAEDVDTRCSLMNIRRRKFAA